MIEISGNLWEIPADAICITTNGFVKANGRCVMGRGCAKEARDKIRNLDLELGHMIHDYGNNVHQLTQYQGKDLFSFPVKHNWWETADLDLIERSCNQLVGKMLLSNRLYSRILIPRPGCGNGGLDWESQVKPILEKNLLGDEYVIVSYEWEA